jgi:hypothetical protein
MVHEAEVFLEQDIAGGGVPGREGAPHFFVSHEINSF